MWPLKFPRLWTAGSCIVVAAALYTCLAPVEMLAPQLELVSDKLQHSVGYIALAVWFGGLYPPARYWAIAAGLFFMGVSVEILQGLMDLGRHADVQDLLANTLGIAAGLLLARLGLGQWTRRLESLRAFERA